MYVCMYYVCMYVYMYGMYVCMKVSNFFQMKYEWDLLAARSIWHFGPTDSGMYVMCICMYMYVYVYV